MSPKDAALKKVPYKGLAPELIHHKRHLEKIINSVADPIFVKNRKHQWVMLNDAFCKFIGHSHDELIGKSDPDFFPKEQVKVFWERDEEVFTTKKENINEEFLTNAQGERKTIQTKKTIYLDDDGNEYLVGVIRDITIQKECENQVRLSHENLEKKVLERTYDLEDRNKKLFEEVKTRELRERMILIQRNLAAELLHVKDLDTALKTVLRHALKIDGFDVGGIYIHDLETKTLILKHSIGLSPVFKKNSRYLDSQTKQYKLVMRGKPFYLNESNSLEKTKPKMEYEGIKLYAAFPVVVGREVIACMNFASKTIYSFSIFHKNCLETFSELVIGSITRINSEDNLRKSEMRYRSLTESSMNSIFCVDKNGFITFVNRYGSKQLRIPAKKIFGLNVLDIFPKEISKQMLKNVQKVFISKKPLRLERSYQMGGLIHWLDTWLVPLNEKDKVVSVMGISRDITEQRQAQKSLEESEDKFRLISDQSILGILIIQDDVFKYINAAAAKIMGYTPKELLKWKPPKGMYLIHPDDREYVMSQIRKKEAGQKDVKIHYRWRLIRKDKTVRWVETYSKSVMFGGKYADLASIVDITDKVKAELELAESEKRYRGLVESQNDLVVRFTPDGRLTFVNDAYCKVFGKTRVKLINRKYTPRIHPSDIELSDKLRKHLVKPPHRVYIEQRNRTVDGYRWFGWEENAILDDGGEIYEIQVVGRDINDIKIAGYEMTAIKTHLETILDGISESIVVLDKNYNIISFNRAFRHWVDKKDVNLTGLKCFSVIHGLNHSCRKCVIRDVFKSKKPSESVHYHQSKNGRVYHEVRAYPIKKDNVIKQAIYIFRDVTDRERMKDRLRENYDQILAANKQLLRLDKMKSEFMAIASHELRTPIAIIKGYTDLLVAGVLGPLSDEQRSKLLRINSNAKHLNQMVSDIMDLTRMDSGEMKFHKSKFSLRKLVKNHVLDVTQLANEKKIKVDFKADVNSLVFADRSRVTQVIVNLTDNALKFTPVGGMIKIRISEGVKNFSISVSDSGIGIPKHEQKHIFERFYQVDSSYQRKFKGVGLGLAISQRIVEYHGGKIRIDSVPNSGTKVTFTLPKAF